MENPFVIGEEFPDSIPFAFAHDALEHLDFQDYIIRSNVITREDSERFFKMYLEWSKLVETNP